MTRRWRVLWVLFFFPLATLAAIPELEAIHPVGAALNTTNSVTVSGKFDPWPPRIWMSRPGLVFRFDTNKNKADIVVAPDATPGPILLRAYNESGISEPRFFVIGSGSETNDIEPNNEFLKPQIIAALPVSISGRLDKSGDVDSFAVALKKGNRLEARVESHLLMSKSDVVLRLVTTNGLQLAWNHDGVTLDPRIVWQVTNDQTVVIQLYGFAFPANSEIRLGGGNEAIYRLHLALTNSPPAFLESPSNSPVTLASTTHGRISIPNDEDTFTFTSLKDQTLEFRIDSASFGSPLDAWMRISDSEGKELAFNDDSEESIDPRLELKASASSNYNIRIGSVTHRGSDEHRYHLKIREIQPTYETTLASSSVIVTNGGTNQIKFNLKRLRGYTNEIVARFDSLPSGVSSIQTNLPSKASGEVSIPLMVATNASPFQGPIRLLLNNQPVTFPLTTRSINNGVPGGYTDLLIDHLPHLWLTVPDPITTTNVSK